MAALEAKDLLLELEDDAVLLVELLPQTGGVGLELGDAGGDGHGCDLAGQIQLVVGVGGDHRQYLVGEVEVGATAVAPAARHAEQSPSTIEKRNHNETDREDVEDSSVGQDDDFIENYKSIFFLPQYPERESLCVCQ